MDNMQIPDHARAKALRATRYLIVFGTLAAAFLAVIILNINTGSVRIPVGRILRILFLRQGEEGFFKLRQLIFFSVHVAAADACDRTVGGGELFFDFRDFFFIHWRHLNFLLNGIHHIIFS